MESSSYHLERHIECSEAREDCLTCVGCPLVVELDSHLSGSARKVLYPVSPRYVTGRNPAVGSADAHLRAEAAAPCFAVLAEDIAVAPPYVADAATYQEVAVARLSLAVWVWEALAEGDGLEEAEPLHLADAAEMHLVAALLDNLPDEAREYSTFRALLG